MGTTTERTYMDTIIELITSPVVYALEIHTDEGWTRRPGDYVGGTTHEECSEAYAQAERDAVVYALAGYATRIITV